MKNNFQIKKINAKERVTFKMNVNREKKPVETPGTKLKM